MDKALVLFCLLMIQGCSSLPESFPEAEEAGRTTLQDESRPVQYVFVSEPTQNDGSPASGISFSVTEKIVAAVLPALKEGQKLYFVGSEQSFSRLSARQAGKTAPLEHITAQPYMWLQDLIEFGEAESGLTAFMSYGNLSVKDTVDKIVRSIAGTGSKIKILNSNAVHGTVGGNFEKWPGNIGVIGSSDFDSSETAADFARQIFPTETILRLPTSWLAIGHIDELVKLVRYRPGNRCEIQFLINSPDAAVRALIRQKEQPLLDELEYGQTRFTGIKSIQELCRRGEIECKRPRNGDLIAALRTGALKTGGSAVKEQLDSLKEVVQSAYREHMPGCAVRWIEAPSIHLTSMKNDKLVAQGGQSVFPSLTNGLLVNETYIVADPGNAAFRKDFAAKLTGLGIKVKYVPFGKDLFQGGPFDGHVHCMTQVLRR